MNRCQATANRHVRGWKGPRPCAKPALPGSLYCWYHQPDRARKFGDGYLQQGLAEREREAELLREQRQIGGRV